MSETTTEPTDQPRRRTAGIAVALVVGLIAGFLGGIAGGALMADDGATGPRGPRGAEGAQGEPGKTGPAGKTGDAAKVPTQIGICYSTSDGSSNSVYFVTGVYISSPVRNADGTTSCPDGTYVAALPQTYEEPAGD